MPDDVGAAQEPTQTAQATGSAPATTFTQEDLDRIVQERLAREKASASKTAAELQAQVEQLVAEKKQREAAEMTELERAQAEAAEHKRLAEQTAAQLADYQTQTMRMQTVMAKGADLSTAYRDRVTGATPDEVLASIEEQRAAQRETEAAVAKRLLEMPESDLRAQYGDELAEAYMAMRGDKPRLPRSVGSASAASGQPTISAPESDFSGGASMTAWQDRIAKTLSR